MAAKLWRGVGEESGILIGGRVDGWTGGRLCRCRRRLRSTGQPVNRSTGLLRDLVQSIWADGHRRAPTVAPIDLEGRAVRLAHRQRDLVVAVRHVQAADHDFAFLSRY